MKKIFGLILIVGTLLQSCSEPPQDPSKAKTSVFAKEQIRQQELRLINDKSMVADPAKAAELVRKYVDYADKYQRDSAAPEYLFKAAELDANVLGAGQAQLLFDRIISNYPEYKKLPEVFFFKAFVYEQKMQNIDQAKHHYERFVKSFPSHPLVMDATHSIENLGLTDEELIKKLKMHNQ